MSIFLEQPVERGNAAVCSFRPLFALPQKRTAGV
jgi:hypothetical protein